MEAVSMYIFVEAASAFGCCSLGLIHEWRTQRMRKLGFPLWEEELIFPTGLDSMEYMTFGNYKFFTRSRSLLLSPEFWHVCIYKYIVGTCLWIYLR